MRLHRVAAVVAVAAVAVAVVGGLIWQLARPPAAAPAPTGPGASCGFDFPVAVGATVPRGARIGTIGTAGGQCPAHLHLELRARSGMPLGGGYGVDTTGYLDPTAFITNHRPGGGVVAMP